MSYQNLDPDQARELIDDGWTYLDVRTEEEFQQGHAPGAYNIPLLFRGAMGMEANPQFLEQVGRAFEKDHRLVVACKAGGRSLKACELLEGAGFQALANMDGGFHGRPDPSGAIVVAGWEARGLPTTIEADAGRSHSDLR